MPAAASASASAALVTAAKSSLDPGLLDGASWSGLHSGDEWGGSEGPVEQLAEPVEADDLAVEKRHLEDRGIEARLDVGEVAPAASASGHGAYGVREASSGRTMLATTSPSGMPSDASSAIARLASTIGVASGYMTNAKVLRAGSRIISITPAKRALATSSAASRVDRGEDLDVDLAAPVDRELEQPHRVTRRRGVEDGDVEGVAAGELDELVERRHLLGAGRVELLAHGRDRLGAPAAGHRVGDDPVV